MEDVLHQALYLGIGIFSGFLSGMLGIGGGAVRVPLLNLAGLPLVASFGINLFVIPFSSAVGAFTHRRNIRWRIAAYMIIGGAAGSAAGAMLAGSLTEMVLAAGFVLISVLTVTGIYLYKLAPKVSSSLRPSFVTVSSGAFILNLITGMRGGSGGSLFPPFLKSVGLDIHEAIATSLIVTIFTALSGLAVYLGRGDVNLVPALFVAAGSVAGSRMGSRVSLNTGSRKLEAVLSVIVILFALLVLYKAL